MDAKEKFRQFISRQGLKQTEPRNWVVDVFLSTEKHVSIQQLFDLVRKKHESIGYATVSRTVKLMLQSGICQQVDFGGGAMCFEHKYDHQHHDHLICLDCGAFVEIYDLMLEKLQDKLVKQHGYVQKKHRLEIFGLCPKCDDEDIHENR